MYKFKLEIRNSVLMKKRRFRNAYVAMKESKLLLNLMKLKSSWKVFVISQE